MARILCVDDEPNVVSLKCAILEAAGHQATAATSAHDAIEKLEHNTYEAVVTDWRLGDARGRASKLQRFHVEDWASAQPPR